MSFWGECSEKQQRQFGFSFFRVAGGTTIAHANDLKFVIAGKQVCRKAWLRAHHISNGRLVVNSDLKAQTKPHYDTEKGPSEKGELCTKESSCKNSTRTFFFLVK